MRKLLSILGTLSLMSSTTVTVVSCGHIGGFFFTGKSLRYDLDTTDLGTFNVEPTYEELIQQTKNSNPNLNLDEVSIVIPRKNKTEIQAIEDFEVFLKVNENSRYYSQEIVPINYRVDYKKELSSVITKDFLTIFKRQVTVDLILNELDEQYDDLKIDQIEVSEINYTQLRIVLTAKSDSTDYVANSRKTLSFSYGDLISLRSVLKNEKPLADFHADVSGFDSSVVINEMKAVYKDINWDEIEPLDDSKFNENKIIFRVKQGSKVYIQDTIEVSFNVYQRVLVDSVITKHNLQDNIFPRTPEFNQANLDKILDEVSKYNKNFHREGIVFDNVIKADDFNGSSENRVTFRVTTASIWYIVGSTFTMTYQRDFHGWNRFVPAGELSNNFVNTMELNPEEFIVENNEIQKNYTILRQTEPLKWAEYDNLLRLTKLSNDTPEQFYAAVRSAVLNFGADNFDRFTREYLIYITAELKSLERLSPGTAGKTRLENFYYDILWGGRTGTEAPNPGRLMAFVRTEGILNSKITLWIKNMDEYVQNWLLNWGSPVRPNRIIN